MFAVFHDVDLLPEDDRNLYTCGDQPRHMSVSVDKFKYKLPYPGRIRIILKVFNVDIQGVPE